MKKKLIYTKEFNRIIIKWKPVLDNLDIKPMSNEGLNFRSYQYLAILIAVFIYHFYMTIYL